LPTKVILKIAGKVVDDNCLVCNRGVPETLNHILNGCRNRFQKVIFRHNLNFRIIGQAILKHKKKPIIKYNSSIVFPHKNQTLPDDTKKLRPDIWFEKDVELFIVEVTMPYGSRTRYNVPHEDGEEEENFEEMSTLEVRRREKIRKYKKLVEDCKKVFDVKVHFFIIVISSLGALSSFKATNLSKLLKYQKRTLSLWPKILSVVALRGSMILYYNLGHKRTESEIPTAIDEDDERIDDPEKLYLHDDLHTEVLKEVNDDVEGG
jgi:hypothetical protein